MFEAGKKIRSGSLKISGELWGQLTSVGAGKHFVASAFVLFSSYILAGAASSFTVPLLLTYAASLNGPSRPVPPGISSIKGYSRPNFHQVKKSVIDRNIFNRDGEYPKEVEEVAEQVVKTADDFDISGPCTPASIKLNLVGTIVLSDRRRSMATVREAGFESDVYREGDQIIGHEEASIASIDPNRVVINNSGKKECLEITLGGKERLVVEKTTTPESKGSRLEGGTVEFTSAYVLSELGEGFGKIIQSARLVPHAKDQRVNGFKIFAIQEGSMLANIGFEDGDVITQVNDTVMTAEQGFTLYQALSDERDISVRVLRKGRKPVTLRIRIK